MKYTPADIRNLPDLCVAQCCTLKIEEDGQRIWICRVAGGVTVETYNTKRGRWNITSGSCSSRSADTDEDGNGDA